MTVSVKLLPGFGITKTTPKGANKMIRCSIPLWRGLVIYYYLSQYLITLFLTIGTFQSKFEPFTFFTNFFPVRPLFAEYLYVNCAMFEGASHGIVLIDP